MNSVPDFFAGLPKDVLLMIPMESDVRSRMRGVNWHLRNTLPDIAEKRFRESRITDAKKCYYACVNGDCELASFFLSRCGSVRFDYSEQFRVWELDDHMDPKDMNVHLSLPIVKMLQPHYKRDPKFFDNIGLYCMYMFPKSNDVLAWIASNHMFFDLKDVLGEYSQATCDTGAGITQIIRFLLACGMGWQTYFISWLIVYDCEFAKIGMIELPQYSLVDFLQSFEWSLISIEKEFVIWCIMNGRYNPSHQDDLYEDEIQYIAQIQQEITKRSY